MPPSPPTFLSPPANSTLQIQENVSLAPFTTLGIGGPARFFVRITSEPDLLAALSFAREHRLPVFALGGGSNLLVPDAGFPGLVLHLALAGPITRQPAPDDAVDFIVPAGTPWDDLVLLTCHAGLSGMECLAGIPGLTGGTPVQNVGAYGQEVADTIRSVRALDLHADPDTLTNPLTSPFLDLPREACHFRYRGSLFNSAARGRYLITAVTFRLSPAAVPNLTYADLARHFAARPTPHSPTPLDVYHAVREIRRAKGMLLVPGDPDCQSAGSFFKNPVVPASTLTHIAATLGLDPATIPHWPASTPSTSSSEPHVKLPAAWLLEHAGFHRGFTLGPVGISSRHSLALINRGGATAADLLALRDQIRSVVQTRFGITLDQEPVEPGPGTILPSTLYA